MIVHILLVLFCTASTQDFVTKNDKCQLSQAQNIMQFLDLIQAKSVVFVYNADTGKLFINSWSYLNKFTMLPLFGNVTDENSMFLPTNYFDFFVIWVSQIEKVIQTLEDKLFKPPINIIKNKNFLFVIKNSQVSDLVSKMQDFLIWRQNTVYLLLQNPDTKCDNKLMYKFSYNQKLQVIEKTEITIQHDSLIDITTQHLNFESQNLSAAINPYYPDAAVINKFPNGTWTFRGYIYDLLSIYICPMLKVRMIDVYGDKVKSPGDDIAILEMMSNKEVDTVTSAIIMSRDRVTKDESTSMAIKIDYVGIAIQESFQINEFMWLTFIKPFPLICWLLFMLLILILTLFNLLPPSINRRSNKTLQTKSTGSLRFLNSTRYFLFFCISFAYSAVLYSSLTVTPNRNPFQSLEDLLDYKKFKFFVFSGSYVSETMKFAKSGQLHQVYNQIKDKKEAIITTREEAYHRVLLGYYAFVFYFDLLKHALSHDCRYHLIKTNCEILLTLAFRKGSIFTEIFSQKLILMKQYGLLGKLKEIYSAERVCNFQGNKSNPITIYHTISLFGLLIVGIITALAVFVVEIIINVLM